MDKKLLEKLKNNLEAEKEKLERELGAFAKEDPKLKDNWTTKYPNRDNGNFEEEADEVQEYENSLSLEHSLELKLKNVNAALEKIGAGARGKYGKCENCGKDIEEKRLLAYPEAKLCIKCNENK